MQGRGQDKIFYSSLSWLEARLTAATISLAVSKNQFIVQLLERELQ
ncbi:toxin-antitoxin system HicB family antitoxin [Photorhabdus heterorhabditis]|nr:toxin-antitoxin system HicB family antitoxin [Photorhabdus heterorhabditis]